MTTRTRLCATTNQLYSCGDKLSIVSGDATVGQHECVLEADPNVHSYRGAGRHHLPCPLTGAVPKLWDALGDELRGGNRLLHAADDLHERSQRSVCEWAAGELFGVARCRETCLHGDVGVQRRPHDPTPAKLRDIH